MTAHELSAKTCYNNGLQLPDTNHCADAGTQFCAGLCWLARPCAGLSEGRIRVATLNITSHRSLPLQQWKSTTSWHSGSPRFHFSQMCSLSTSFTCSPCPFLSSALFSKSATCLRIHAGATLKQEREKIATSASLVTSLALLAYRTRH